jgi:outer membrane protein assembly factor BamB
MRLPTPLQSFASASLSSLASLTVLTALALPVSAVFADEAYEIDYHHALLGLPLRENTFFHRPRRDEKASLLVTLSDLGVLGAVNPGNGALVWRQFLGKGENRTIGGKGRLAAKEGENRLVTTFGGYVNAWDAKTGREVWYNNFGGRGVDVSVFENGEVGNGDVLALFEDEKGTRLRRLSAQTGDVVWEFAIEHGDVPIKVSNNGRSVFVVSLHGARGGYNIRVTAVELVAGKKVEENLLTAKADVHSPEDVLFVGANPASPIVAWADRGLKNLKVNILGTKQIQTLSLGGGSEDIKQVEIHAPHLVQSQPHFLVHSQSATHHWADVYHVDIRAATVSEAYHVRKLAGKGAFSTSSQDASVYFTRHTEDDVIVMSSASPAILGCWPLSKDLRTGRAVHAVSEVVSKSANTYAVRSAVVTTDDNWTMIRNGELAWNRVEGLSGGVAAAFAEIPEEEALAKSLEEEAHSNPLQAYIHRITRHFDELRYLPDYLQNLPGRFVSSLLPGDVTPIASSSLARDNFGFRKLIILATERGRLFALDSANQGSIVWSIKAFELPVGEKWDVKGIFVDNARGHVTVRGSKGEYIIIKTMDGATVEIVPQTLQTQIQSTALIDTPSGKLLLPVNAGGQIGPLEKNVAPKHEIVVQGKDNEINGLKYETNGGNAIPVTVWTFKPASGERILSVTARPFHDPVASIGRALSDRTVLYKYLNPNTILITAVSDKAATATFYLLDSVSGDVLYSVTNEGVDITEPITSALTENWFVYSLWSDISSSAALPSAKGYQIIITELYESPLANDRGPLGSASNFSSLEPAPTFEAPTLPHVITQSFLIPGPISHMAITQTRQGITSRQLLAFIPTYNSIIGLPRNLLDPRRPVGRKLTNDDMAEGLVAYSPVIEFDPRMMISHMREVVGVRDIIAAPALLESTSLVFAYGVDVFGTRVTPSLAFDLLGKGFNRIALVGTVVALAVGVGFVAPMVSFFLFFGLMSCVADKR